MNYSFPKIMGIVNVTPDSFSDGGDNFAVNSAVDSALKMIDDGAEIVDIGGESSRPGAIPVFEHDELQRVIPVIKKIISLRPETVISIDTTKYSVARAALDSGAKIINDISGLNYDENLAELATEYNSSLIIMHMNGTPQTMQHRTEYDNLVVDVKEFLENKIKIAKSKGVNNIIIDYGIGFGKNEQQNIELLKKTEQFQFDRVEILVGISRKSFIGKLFDIPEPKDRDIASTLIHALLLDKPIDIIRVHNVEIISLLKKINTVFS